MKTGSTKTLFMDKKGVIGITVPEVGYYQLKKETKDRMVITKINRA